MEAIALDVGKIVLFVGAVVIAVTLVVIVISAFVSVFNTGYRTEVIRDRLHSLERLILNIEKKLPQEQRHDPTN